jgi:ribosomal protein L44E
MKNVERISEKQRAERTWFTRRRSGVTPKIITLPRFPSDKLLTRVPTKKLDIRGTTTDENPRALQSAR